MRTRHKIPSIFNLSMVDVLCCALGSVILLWLLNLREAKQQTEESAQAAAQLAVTRDSLSQSAVKLAEAKRQAVTLQLALGETTQQAVAAGQRLASVTIQLDDARRQATARAADLERTLAGLREEKQLLEGRLAAQQIVSDELGKKLAAANQRVSNLENQTETMGSEALVTARQARELAERLAAAETRVKQLQLVADQVPDLEGTVKSYRDKYTTEAAMARALETEISRRTKELAETEKKLDTYRTAGQQLEQDKAALARDAERLRAATQNRFEGIHLAGKRVIFLVDMSGSMELVDENTVAPAKWLGVRETVAKVLASLPDVEKFQVIAFSDRVIFPLGHGGEWLDYDPRTSRDQALKALAAIKPVGGTDMHTALDAAFKYRAQGLDAIYMLSDGLPNIGEGLTAQQARALKETERCEILSAYIRKKLKTTWNRPGPGGERVRIHAIGFFYESPDVGAFLWALARDNDGSFVGMSKP